MTERQANALESEQLKPNPKIHEERRSDLADNGKEPISGFPQGTQASAWLCFWSVLQLANLPVIWTDRFLEVILHV